MPGRFFRILTPDGLLSQDRFVLPTRQPLGIALGCISVVHERTGAMLIVHDTRLFPADAARTVPVERQRPSVCRKCGHVAGIAEDCVSCPEHYGAECGIRRPAAGLTLARCV